MTQPEATVWFDTLRRFRLDDVQTALAEIRASSDWMPTHHQLVSTTQAVARRRALAEAAAVPVLDETAGPQVVTPQDEGTERIRAIRNLLHPVPE